jgi:hypothetical protein
MVIEQGGQMKLINVFKFTKQYQYFYLFPTFAISLDDDNVGFCICWFAWILWVHL